MARSETLEVLRRFLGSSPVCQLVTLSRVHLEGGSVRLGRLPRAPDDPEHFPQVGECLGMGQEKVACFCVGECLTGKTLRLFVLAHPGKGLRPNRAPADLRVDVVGAGSLLTFVREVLGLFVSPLHVEGV